MHAYDHCIITYFYILQNNITGKYLRAEKVIEEISAHCCALTRSGIALVGNNLTAVASPADRTLTAEHIHSISTDTGVETGATGAVINVSLQGQNNKCDLIKFKLNVVYINKFHSISFHCMKKIRQYRNRL